MKENDMHLFERYLEGELNQDERSEMNTRLLSDSAFAEEYNQFIRLRKEMDNYRSRLILKDKMNRIHQQHFPAGFAGFILSVWRKHSASIAVAACVSIISFSVLFFSSDLILNLQRPKTVYKELRRDLEKIEKAQAAIIKDIHSRQNPREKLPLRYGGTGFAISQNGFLVTSYHLIKGAQEVFVENKQGDTYFATPFYTDVNHDLAILKIRDSSFRGFKNIPFNIKNKVSDLGEKVFTLGYPREDVVFGEGTISCISGYQGDSSAYQVSIPVNPGNSGGPVFDDAGNLIGIISGKQLNTEGAAFAVKSEFLLNTIHSIPKDSLKTPIKFNKQNNKNFSRAKFLKSLQDVLFVVKVYN